MADYHYEDAEVLAAVEGTEHIKQNIARKLLRGTSGEKWSLYRAIASLACADLERQLCETGLTSEERLEVAEDKLRLIADWCAAYPLEEFPKPNMMEVRALLGDTLLTQLSAYNMRHVCEGIAEISQAGGSDAVEESKTAQHPLA
jgi:hypothetical protein